MFSGIGGSTPARSPFMGIQQASAPAQSTLQCDQTPSAFTAQLMSDTPGFHFSNMRGINLDKLLQSDNVKDIQAVFSKLSNADQRSYQLLADTFMRLKKFISEPPLLISFSYEIETNEQALLIRKNQLDQKVSELGNFSVSTLYDAAVKGNPNSEQYAVVPVHGLDGMIQRTETQRAHFERIQTYITELLAQQEKLRTHMDIDIYKRIKDMKMKQRLLQTNLLSAISLLEEYALQNSSAQIDLSLMRRVQEDIAKMSEDLDKSVAGRNNLQRLKRELLEIASFTGIPVTGKGDISEGLISSSGRLDKLRKRKTILHEHDIRIITGILHQMEKLSESLEIAFKLDSFKATKILQSIKLQNQTE